MIDQERIRALMANKGASAPVPKEVSSTLDLSGLSIGQLSQLRDEVTDLLPDTGKMDLHKELATQYILIKEYQSEVRENNEVPPNQVAQVMNSTVAALAQLIKLQEALERVEAFKKMETCLIEAVTLLPEPARVKFFDEYEAMASSRGIV